MLYLVQITTCRVFVTDPLSELILVYCLSNLPPGTRPSETLITTILIQENLSAMNDYIYHNMRDETDYQFPNFNGAAVEVWEWINNFIHILQGM